MARIHLAHRMSYTRFYRIFVSARKRCEMKQSKDYPAYGALGIRFMWRDFFAFKKDMYDSYLKHVNRYGEKNTSLDRINGQGHYSKGNCRWATFKVQANNRVSNIRIKYRGKERTLTEWGEKFGLRKSTIWNRFRRKWPVHRLFQKKRNYAQNTS